MDDHNIHMDDLSSGFLTIQPHDHHVAVNPIYTQILDFVNCPKWLHLHNLKL